MKFLKAILLTVAIAAPAAANAEDNNVWRIGASGGTTLYAGDNDPQFASIEIAREFRQGYVEIGYAIVRGGVTNGLLNAVPVDSETVTLSAGRSFGDLGVDTYIGVGRRSFDTEFFQQLGRTVTINSDGSSFAVGGALSYDVSFTDSLIFSPFAAIDYDKVDIGRAVTLPGGSVRTVKSEEEGITGSLGASLQKVLGAHVLSANAAFIATSNSSAARSGTGTGSQIISALNVPGQSDEWLQLGAAASFAIGKMWRLNFNAGRSVGFTGPEATSLSAGVSLRF